MSATQTTGFSADAKAMMTYEANKKSTTTAFILWVLVGVFAAHKFYLGKPVAALLQIVCLWGGLLFSFVYIGVPFVAVAVVWLLIDLFRIPGLVRKANTDLIGRLGA